MYKKTKNRLILVQVEKAQLPEEEERHQGTVGFSVYYQYFKSGSSLFMFLLCVFLLLATQASYIFIDLWLAQW